MVLDITVARLRLILEAIRHRLTQDEHRKLVLLEWQTKVLSSFIATTAFTDKDGHKVLAEAVEAIHLLPRPKEQPKPKEPEPGSYERMMGMLGGLAPG